MVSGRGKLFLNSDDGQTDNLMDLQHERVIKEFVDKEFALEINQALLVLEKASMKEFYKLGCYMRIWPSKGWRMSRIATRSLNTIIDE